MITGFGNNVVSSLASDITAGQTEIPVMPGSGVLFAGLLTYDYDNPSNTLRTYAKLTLTDSKETSFEVCHLISVSNDVLTVIRGQEGTTAKGWSLNDVIANFATRGSENQFVQIDHLQSGFYCAGVAEGTENALMLHLPSSFFLNGSTDWMLRTPVIVYPTLDNTGAATLQLVLGGTVLGAFPLYKGDKAQLVAGDILKDTAIVCLLDKSKTFFSVMNPGAIYAGLGTAATHDVTTSRTDTTPGHVLQVGDYGLGVANGSAPFLSSIYDIKCSGEYNALGDGTSTPTTGIPEGSGNTRFAVSAGNIYGNQYLVTLTSNVHFYVGLVNTSDKTSNWSQFYNTLNKPSASDTGAIPANIIGNITNNGSMADAKTNGWWQITVADPSTVPGFPKYPNGNYLYGYGYMFSWVNGNTWFQIYYSHHGANATRQNWAAGPDTATVWVIEYNTANKPTSADVGAYTKAESDARYLNASSTLTRLGAQVVIYVPNDATVSAPAGCVSSAIRCGNNGSLTGLGYRPLQILVNGNWVNVQSL